MTTERIDIVISERGSKVVRRDIEAIAGSANKSADAVDFLKRALGFLAGALAIQKVAQYADAWASAAGQIAIATKSTEEAATVTDRLFASAQRTRSGFTDLVELYARVARAGGELGTSQERVIQFTEGIGKALAVQGVTASAAKGALLQLGQALGSGTVRAEEFNSVLEGAPIILQVVADNLKGVDGSIARLRQRLLDGKLSSKDFFEAFLAGQAKLESQFAKAPLTIGQSVTLVTNALTRYVGELDKALGISEKIGKAARFIAQNFDQIAAAVGKLTSLLLTGAAAWVTYNAAMQAGAIAAQLKAFLEYQRALAAGTVVTLGSAEANRQRAASILAATTASASAAAAEKAASAAATVEAARAAAVTVQSQALRAAAARTEIETLRTTTVAKLAATQAEIRSAQATIASAEAAGALSFALATKRTALVQLTAAESAHAALLKQLSSLDTRRAAAAAAQTEALAAQTAAQTALNTAQANSAAANAAAAAASTRATTAAAAAAAGSAKSAGLLATGFNLVSAAVSSAVGYVARFFAFLNANPLVALATTLVLVTGLVLGFGDQIKLGTDQVTTLADLTKALGEVALSAFETVRTAAGDAFDTLSGVARTALDAVSSLIPDSVKEWLSGFSGFYDGVGTGFAGVVRIVARTFDAIGGLVAGLALLIQRAVTGIPGLFQAAFGLAYNAAAGYIEDIVNTAITGINKLRSLVGRDLLETVKIERLQVNESAFEQYGADIASAISDGFQLQGGFLEKSVNTVFDRAGEIAQDRIRKLLRKLEESPADLTKAIGKGTGKIIDPKEIDKARDALRQLLDRIAPAEGALLEMAKAEKTLDNARKLGLISSKDQLRYVELLRLKYRDAVDPLGALNRELDKQTKLLGLNSRARAIESQFLDAQKALLDQGIILTREETDALREKITELNRLNEVVAAQDQLLANSVEQRRAFSTQLEAITNLLADPTSGFTKTDATDALAAQQPDLFAGTQEAIDAQLARFQELYRQIDLLRGADLISEQTAAQMRAKVEIQAQEARLTNTQTFYSSLSQLSRSGNRKLAAIGKAAAAAQATIDGILAVQKALASAPPPLNYALAAAVGIAAADNVARIVSSKGFSEGGYTGDVGRGSIAGVVHGQEFVVNAEATARNRSALEAMNSGRSAGGGITVNIESYGTPKRYEVQEMGPDAVRIIARDEAELAVARRAPAAVASDLDNPNSVMSKSLARNLQTERRRG